MLATTRTEGIRDNLLSIADSVQERLRAVRAVENERAKPRQTARLVTIISAMLIGTTAFLGGGYFAGATLTFLGVGGSVLGTQTCML